MLMPIFHCIGEAALLSLGQRGGFLDLKKQATGKYVSQNWLVSHMGINMPCVWWLFEHPFFGLGGGGATVIFFTISASLTSNAAATTLHSQGGHPAATGSNFF